MNFIIECILKTILIMLVMTLNNLLWINKGGEWYGKAVVRNRFNSWKGPIRYYSFKNKIKYFFGYRVVTVWTNWRDWVSAIVGGLILTLIC